MFLLHVRALTGALAALAFTATADASHVLSVPLNKQYVPVIRKGRTVMHKTAYFGDVTLGADVAQQFRVVFDTGSGHLFVPSRDCRSVACQTKRTYARVPQLTTSNGSVQEVENEVAIAYGTGEIEGDAVHEQVCLDLDRRFCARAGVVLATTMSEEPFSEFAFDGVLGLGLPGLAVDAEHSVLGQIFAQNPSLEPRFAILLGEDTGPPSVITFGGYDESRVEGDVRWADVVRPEHGHWMLNIRSVRVGDQTLDLCAAGDCYAVADSGTSLLGVPAQISKRMNMLLARVVPEREGPIDCREELGPELVLDVGGVELRLDSQDYSRPSGLRVENRTANTSQFVCRAQVLPISPVAPLGAKAFILGEPVLRRYYTIFDWANQRVGFGKAKTSPVASPSLRGSASGPRFAQQRGVVIGAPSAESLEPSVVTF